MRTTIEVPEPLFRNMKSLASQKGQSLKEFVVRAIELEVSRTRQSGRSRFAVQLPLVRSKRPGALRSLTNAEIEDLLD